MMHEFDVYAGWLSPEEKIGRCIIENARGNEIIGFAYDKSWLVAHSGFSLDPDIYPMEGLQFPPSGKPCFGFLSDTSPDRWGRKLMERREALEAKEEGRPKRKLQESDYIIGVHDGGRIGGIRFFDKKQGIYLSDRKTLAAPPMEKLRELEQAAAKIDEDPDVRKWIKNLIDPGSSLGGARPKANVVDEHGNVWIAKFPSARDEYDIGAWEMVAHNLSVRCGIDCPEARVMRFSDRGHTYLSKRFDRTVDRRIHYASAMTMAGRTDMEPAGYMDIISAIESVCASPAEDLMELWKRMVFSICISNTDDHLRNHGFLLSEEGWRLSPCFDVNPDPDKDHMALAIGYDTVKSLDNAIEMADFFRISAGEAKEIVRQIQGAIKNSWETEADRLKISHSDKERMRPAFDESYREIGLTSNKLTKDVVGKKESVVKKIKEYEQQAKEDARTDVNRHNNKEKNASL